MSFFDGVPTWAIIGIAVLAWLGAHCSAPEMDKCEKALASGDDDF